MSNISRAPLAVGLPTPKAIINGFATSGYTPASLSSAAALTLAQLTSGAITANTLTSMPGFPYTGGGSISALMATVADATSRTLRVQLILDGVIVFDSTSAATTLAGNGCQVIGSAGASNAVEMDQVAFAKSIDLKVCSNITETGKIYVGIAWRKN